MARRLTEPSSVSSVDVHVNAEGVQSLKSVDGALLVSSGSAGTLGDVHVGDHVGERIGLDDGDDTDIGVL